MRLVITGGFLGSGKTTAIHQASQELMQRGVAVGVITNDQGDQLVDSGFVQGSRIPLAEVTGGCFCCRYNELDQCIRTLGGAHRPQLIFAESVGSCTDLVATVVHPLLMYYPALKITLCVFADAPLLLHQAQQGSAFDECVEYIYNQQLEEADIVVLNKTDLLGEAQRKALKQLVAERYASKVVLYQNSLDKASISEWIAVLQGDFPAAKRKTLDLDYDQYATGEEALAWLDQRLELTAPNKNAFELGAGLIQSIHQEIRARNWPIGHLKFLLSDGVQSRKISFTQTSGPGVIPTQSTRSDRLEILINARVQTSPELLQKAVAGCISNYAQHCTLTQKQCSAFKPGYPRPVHRIP